jgi:hypothetical protein
VQVTNYTKQNRPLKANKSRGNQIVRNLWNQKARSVYKRTRHLDRLWTRRILSTPFFPPPSRVTWYHPLNHNGPGSVVGIATGYGLDGPRIESRWRRDFPHLSRMALGPSQPPVQWVPGLSRGKERPGLDSDPSSPSNAVGQERVQLYLYSPYGPYGLNRASVPVQGCALPLPLPNQTYVFQAVSLFESPRKETVWTMSRLSHLPWRHHRNILWVQIKKLLIMSFSPVSGYFLPPIPMSKYLPRHPVLKHSLSASCLRCADQVSDLLTFRHRSFTFKF